MARELGLGMGVCLKILRKLLQEKTSVPPAPQDTVIGTLRKENTCLTDLALFPALAAADVHQIVFQT
jgi:hypothetical protein